jgi:SagB-type dehydrogenase family enzyme
MSVATQSYTLHRVRSGEPAPPRPPGAELVLSRFAVVHRDGPSLVLESPRAWCDMEIHDPALLGVLGALVAPTDPETLPPGLLDDLWSARFVVPAAGSDEDTELRLRQWGPFELWLHARSRLSAAGGFNGSWGLTGWGEGVFPPLPARHDGFPGPSVDLFRPDLDGLRATDPPLTAVLEDRCSVREHDAEHPLTADQLGEFLYRCARVRGVSVLDGIEHVDRPFPSGGALHELEFYPLVRDVAGLAPGLHHYDGHAHRLTLVSGPTEGTAGLLTAAELASGAQAPQVLIVLAARFGRLMWKYEGMGYAAILKDVGVALGVMYAVATAMGLAPCALGGGHAELFNEVTGLDYLAESVVGEFLLGSRKAAP